MHTYMLPFVLFMCMHELLMCMEQTATVVITAWKGTGGRNGDGWERELPSLFSSGLRLHTSNVVGVGSIPHWETKIPHLCCMGNLF